MLYDRRSKNKKRAIAPVRSQIATKFSVNTGLYRLMKFFFLIRLRLYPRGRMTYFILLNQKLRQTNKNLTKNKLPKSILIKKKINNKKSLAKNYGMLKSLDEYFSLFFHKTSKGAFRLLPINDPFSCQNFSRSQFVFLEILSYFRSKAVSITVESCYCTRQSSFGVRWTVDS